MTIKDFITEKTKSKEDKAKIVRVIEDVLVFISLCVGTWILGQLTGWIVERLGLL